MSNKLSYLWQSGVKASCLGLHCLFDCCKYPISGDDPSSLHRSRTPSLKQTSLDLSWPRQSQGSVTTAVTMVNEWHACVFVPEVWTEPPCRSKLIIVQILNGHSTSRTRSRHAGTLPVDCLKRTHNYYSYDPWRQYFGMLSSACQSPNAMWRDNSRIF